MAAHVTAEDHRSLENRVDKHDVQLAVHETLLTNLDDRMADIVDELKKTRWTFITFICGLAGSGVAAVVFGGVS